MKLIISGSRYITDGNILRKAVFEWAKQIHGENIPLPLNAWIDEIIEGGAKGVDSLAGNFAEKHGINHITFHANWKKFGPAAGPLRNEDMAKYGKLFPNTWVLAIPQSTKGGTQNMITYSTNIGLDVFVVKDYINDNYVS